MASPSSDNGHFHSLFERRARRIRGRFLLRRALTGMALGLLVAVGVALAIWWTRHTSWLPWVPVLAAVGALFGLVSGSWRRWTDTEVALYLDARLDSGEAIATAVELRSQAEREEVAREAVVRKAAALLESLDPHRVRPRLWQRLQALGPLGALGIVGVGFLPLRPLPPPPELPPGSELVQKDNLAGLEKLEALAKLEAKDPAQKKELEAIAEEARKLREDLKKGLPRREAQARLARLRDRIAEQQRSLGNDKNRRGLEAALGKLSKNPKLGAAARALGDGDIQRFDDEMQKLANQAEKEDREAAKEALKEAAEAAKKNKADDVARSLEEQKKLFEQREAQSEALRELAKGLGENLGEDAKRQLEELGRSGSPEAQRRLAEALGKALEGMTPEERKRLAERLQEGLNSPEQQKPMSQQELEDLSKELASPEAQKQLQEHLKELGKPESSKERERQQGLEEGERGGGQCQSDLQGVPVPTPGKSKPGGQKGQEGGSKRPGSQKDRGTADHEGEGGSVSGKELRAKAKTRINPALPLQGATLGHAPGSAAETANRAGTGQLGKVRSTEIGGVEHSQVPREYREQVGRYFQP